MRVLAKNQNDTFRFKAYAGTNGVLLAFDLDKSRTKDFLGFAVEQKEAGKQWQWLLNSLTFAGKTHTLPRFNATESIHAPFQKFRWADYSIDPGTVCDYRVHLMYKGQPNPGESLQLQVKTDDGKPANHKVFFNRAVTASQGFERKFPEVEALIKKKKKLPIEKWPAAPREWLENGLLDTIVNFIGRATDNTWALDVAIYEYELKAIVDAVNAAHGRNADVRVLYHAKSKDKQTTENKKSLKNIPADKKRGRVTSKIFHDKFIVLSKVLPNGKRDPQAVLSGSTNFTENGVYRQANVVHIVDNPALAKNYLNLFDTIWDSPKDVSVAKTWIDTNNPLSPQTPFWSGFSPRADLTDLAEFVRIINGADKDVLFTTAFALPEDILDALLGKAHDSVLRYGIQNSASKITGYHADRTAEFTTPAMLKGGLDGWVKEGLKGQAGNLRIHSKIIVANFTTDKPTIVSGSHNFSKPASGGNDENYFIIRGDMDLADRYGIEVIRFYEHYRFRYYAEKLKLKEVQPLVNGDSWTKPYYKAGNLKETSRLRFAGR